MVCLICANQDKSQITPSFLPKYFYCQKCKGHFLPKELKEKSRYPEEYFAEKSTPTFVNKVSVIMLDFFLKLKVVKIEAIFKSNSQKKILDYGCGTGKLIKQLERNGFEATGFEPSTGALSIARNQGLKVFRKVQKIKGGYDLIMFWHSLEHTPRPVRVLKSIKTYLKSGGKILIAVPNADSIEARLFKKLWFHYTYPMHRVHFTPKSITKMLAREGFKIEEMDFFNPEYTLTGLGQSFLNIFLPENVLYSVVSHRRYTLSKNLSVFYSLLSFILLFALSPIILAIFFIQLIFKKTGAIVVTANYARKVSN